MLEFAVGFILGYFVCAPMVKSAIRNALDDFEDEHELVNPIPKQLYQRD